MKRNSIMQASENATIASTEVATTVAATDAATIAPHVAATIAPSVASLHVAPTAATAAPHVAPTAATAATAALHVAPTAATAALPVAAAPSTLTDVQLYQQCKYYGKQAKGWMRKFESLLPEVYRRRLYKRRGFAGIHEFAQKLAGMSRDKVDRILRLSRKIEEKPALKEAFESGELGYTKIDEIAFIATSETETIWIEKARNLSHIALRREIACARSGDNLALFTDVGNFEPEKMTDCDMAYRESAGESPPTGVPTNKVSLNMRPETELKLRALQHELEKARGEKLSLGETIETLINREHENLIAKAQRKKTANYCPDCVKKRADEAAAKSEVARAVPAEIRHTVLARQDYRCVGGDLDMRACGGEVDGSDTARDTGCTHPPTELHHMDGWAMTRNHDPDRMRYLCKKHHAEVHADDTRVQAYRSG